MISDQRMPEMTGVEFLAKVYEKYPNTVRMILTGFADMDATIGAINDGHVYAYVTKPWDQDQLKQVVRRAVEHHRLACENERLLARSRGANVFLQSVMDQLDTGALAVDAAGVVRAANRAARDYLGLGKDPRGQTLAGVLGAPGLEGVASARRASATSAGAGSEEIELARGGKKHRLRVRCRRSPTTAARRSGAWSSRARCRTSRCAGASRSRWRASRAPPTRCASAAQAQGDLRKLAGEAGGSDVGSPAMAELAERASRAATAIDHWLAVDDVLAARTIPTRSSCASACASRASRWPFADRLPARVAELARRVEAYYESGENTKQPVL